MRYRSRPPNAEAFSRLITLDATLWPRRHSLRCAAALVGVSHVAIKNFRERVDYTDMLRRRMRSLGKELQAPVK